MVSAEKVGNRIHLRTRWAPDVPEKCKSVSGARWSASKKVWTYPLDWGTCVALRRVWGSALKVGVELADWAREAKSANERLLALGKAAASDLGKVRDVAPKLAEAMSARTYQQVGAAYIATGRSVLIGDQPGMGKTLETLAGVIESGVSGPILVFCPKTAMRTVWKREIERWIPQDRVWVAEGSKKNRQVEILDCLNEAQMHPNKRSWLICNIEMARVQVSENGKDAIYPELFTHPGFSAIVVDESHRALICRAGVLKKMSQQRAGMALLPLRENGLRIALSGTPWRGKPENFWGTLNWLRPEVYTSFWRWAEKWFQVDNNGWGSVIGKMKPGMQESFAEEMRTIMLRRTKKECLPDLPDKSYTDIWLSLEGAQKKAYDGMANDAIAHLDSGMLSATGVLAEMTRLKQFAITAGRVEIETGEINEYGYAEEKTHFFPSMPSNKFDWLLDFLAERGIDPKEPAGNAKVVVASQFTSVINLFAANLREKGLNVHVLTGETGDRDRDRIVQEFQEEDCSPQDARIVLLNTKAGGVSITLDAADDLVFIDETYIPDDQEQVEDRVHRASRIHNVNIYTVRSEGTIDEAIAKTNMEREQIQKNLMDGSRGVELARQLVGK